MEFRLAIRGDLRKQTAAVGKAAEDAVATVTRRYTTLLKSALRREIIRAGLGERLANTVQSLVFPERGGSIDAKGRVFSKAIYRRPGGLIDLLTVFEEGAVIVARDGKLLLVGGRTFQKAGGRLARVKVVRILPKINLRQHYERLTAGFDAAIAAEFERRLVQFARAA